MKQKLLWQIVLSNTGGTQNEQLEIFALLNLGLVQSLTSGALSVIEAIHRFYNAENCIFVRNHLRNKVADTIMSRGVQLPDLFDCLPAEEAQREFYHELEKMRTMSLTLLERKQTLHIA